MGGPVEKYAMFLKYISKDKMNKFCNAIFKKTKRDIEVQNYFFNNMKFEDKFAYAYFDYKQA